MHYRVRRFTALIGAVVLGPTSFAYSGARTYLTESIRMPSAEHGQAITRRTLRAAERSAIMPFAVSLKMRNMDSLEAKLTHGQQIPQDDLEAYYLPPVSDYQAMQAWLVSQGFVLGLNDPNHTILFASGTVSQLEGAFGVTFARVTTADGEFTSAISAPSVPVELAGSTLSIVGLQPHIRMHQNQISPASVSIPRSSAPEAAPSDVLAQYNAPANFNGTGQTIAIIMDGTCLASDYDSYCSLIGLNQTAANFLTTIPIEGGAGANGGGGVTFNNEASLDVQTASGMAPGAKVRLYATNTTGFIDAQAACIQILSDAKANNITVVSMSEGTPENTAAGGAMLASSQTFAQLAAAGITVLAASGDGGSNPKTFGLGYDPAAPLTPEYPATDPFVTGVGGTMMTITQSTFSRISETGSWDVPGGAPFSNGASGGGISTVFSRPSWQTDGGPLLSGSANRCVPDIAAVQEDIIPGVTQVGLVTIVNGIASGSSGTSVSSPLWAGLVADLNHARANAGIGPIGLLGPAIYPLHASGFTDITAGSNGAYTAGPGYDLVTGLGVPNLAALITGILAYNPGVVSSTAPIITIQPQSTATIPGGSCTLSVTATGTSLSYQWYHNGLLIFPGESSKFANVTGSTLSITGATTNEAGSYTVSVYNAAGSVMSNAATVSVSASAPSITNQPQPVIVNAGSPFSLSVTATGATTLTYQWFLGSSAISGATGSTYSVSSAANADAGSYTVKVTNSAGSVTSASATVTVSTPTPTPTPTPAPTPAPAPSSSGGGGGGGAASLWFYLLLGAAVLLRLKQRRFA